MVGSGGDPLEDALGDPARLCLVESGQDEGELVSADPEGSTAVRQAGCDAQQHLVPGRVTETVVDLFEVVDVDDAERQRVAGSGCAPEIPLELLREAAIVAEAGQAIGGRKPGGLRERRAVAPAEEHGHDRA